MKRGFIVLAICALVGAAYFTMSKWAIRHTTLTFVDPVRSDRTVSIDVAVRRDREVESMSDMIELRHEAFDRRGFAEGAVRAAEWLCGKNGVWEFQEIFEQV